MDPSAGIVIIGDEILSGKFADENASFLLGELRALGVRLRRIDVIPDDEAEIAETVARAASRFDHVFTSGGVGPTHDDVTMAGIARGFATTVELHPELERLVERYYGGASASQRRLAQVPAGCELIYGAGSDVPVVRLRNVYILPGVPSLFRAKFLAIRERFRSTPFVVARVHCATDETHLADALTAVVARFPAVGFGSYPRFDETPFRVILTLESKAPDELRAALAALVAALAGLVVRVDEPGL